MSQTDLSWLRWWNISIILPLIASHALTLLLFFFFLSKRSHSRAVFHSHPHLVVSLSMLLLLDRFCFSFILWEPSDSQQSAGGLCSFFRKDYNTVESLILKSWRTMQNFYERHNVHTTLCWFVHLQILNAEKRSLHLIHLEVTLQWRKL